MKRLFSLPLFVLFCFNVMAQPRVISGPMLGPVELRDAKVWIEVSQDVKTLSLQCNKINDTKNIRTIAYKGELGNEFNPVCFTIGGLEPDTKYQYKIWINGKTTTKGGEFTTKEL